MGDNRTHVIGDEDLEHAAEETPGRFAAVDDRVQSA
jgi:hypothetical protein